MPDPNMSAHDSLRTHWTTAVLQQCMHCGMCLPTCPTYDATRLERNSPRGRIALHACRGGRAVGSVARVRGGNVFLPGLPGVRDGLSRPAWTMRTAH